MTTIRWFLLLLFMTLNTNSASPSIEEEFVILNRSQFTAIAVYIGTEMGRNWAADITNKVIWGSVKNPNFLVNWTLGSIIRGRNLVEALPIAGKRGAQIGAVVAAVCAPVAFDAVISIWKSCKKTLRPLWDDDIPKREKATTWDRIITSIMGAGISGGIIWIFPLRDILRLNPQPVSSAAIPGR